MPEPPVQAPSRWVELRQTLREQWWVHLLIALAITVIFNDLDPGRWPQLLQAYGVSLVFSVCIGTATTLVYVLGWRTLLLPGGPVRRALAHGSSIVAGVLVGAEVAMQLLRLVLSGLDVDAARLEVWRVGLVVTVVVMMGSLTYDQLRERARAVELREQRAQQELLRAQIDSLQARVNPHFLFNALNTVASLVEEEPERAVEAIERLSALLRYSLEGAREGVVPLRRELDAVRGYLALEGLRFGERLRGEVEVAEGLDDAMVPPFVLQPLVENAVKHGIGSRREGGRVRVTVDGDAQRLRLRVEDDGPGRSSLRGTQVGHENLRQRLELLYGEAASFRAEGSEGRGYRVELLIPREARAEALAHEGSATLEGPREVAAS